MTHFLGRSLLTLLLFCQMSGWAQAHFLWIVAGDQSPDGKAHVYFSESATPDDPALIDRVQNLRIVQVEPGRLTPLSTGKGQQSLEAVPTSKTALAFVLSHDYGLLTRGEASFLLNYHGKCYASDQPTTWIAIADPAALPLEITPRLDEEHTVLKVLWQGQPLPEAAVTIEGDELETIEGTTEKTGEFRAKLPLGRKYSIRAKHVLKEAGERDGHAYTEVRHYSTLALKLPTSVAVSGLPELAPAITSFGAAMLGEDVYVYGGHAGAPHHYSREGQSGRFVRLNLQRPTAWEVLGEGPKLTGLAMVPYDGKLYRIGGFTATNSESEEQNLVSSPAVAVFDPRTNAWTEETPLPVGRSSHDAVILGNRVYVVGGWMLNGGRENVWHRDIQTADLTARPLKWEALEQPFERRALSVGTWKGQLVVIGGMQKEGGTTTITSIYDPERKVWRDGPPLRGTSMDGFGSSAFALGEELYVSTMSGSLQRLSADGTRWDSVSQLAHPRFFHRMLPTTDGKLLFVGGASMKTGKITIVEWFAPPGPLAGVSR